MTNPQIHGRWRSFSVSKALDTLGASLRTIRDEDGLTWKEVGRIIGKSDDRASDYANGLSEMPVGAFLLACREWNGRFANAALSMIGMSLVPAATDDVTDTTKVARLSRLLALMTAAIADVRTPGEIDDEELDTITDEELDEAESAIAVIRQRKAAKIVKLGLVA